MTERTVRLSVIGFVGIAVMIVGVGVLLGSMAFTLHPGKRVRLCDEAVQSLMTTRDLVELHRATFLVKWFNCNIAVRVP